MNKITVEYYFIQIPKKLRKKSIEIYNMFQNYSSIQIFNFINNYSKVNLDIPLRDQAEITRETLTREGYIVTEELYVTKLFNRDILRLISIYLDYEQIINLKQVSRFFNSAFPDDYWKWYLKQKYHFQYKQKSVTAKVFAKYFDIDLSKMDEYSDDYEICRRKFISQKYKFEYLFAKYVHKYKFFISTEEVNIGGYQLIGKSVFHYNIDLKEYNYERFKRLDEIPYGHIDPVFDEIYTTNLTKLMINWWYYYDTLSNFRKHIVENVDGISLEDDAIYHSSILHLDEYIIDGIEHDYDMWIIHGYVKVFIYRESCDD